MQTNNGGGQVGNPKEESALTLLQQIKDGQISPGTINKEARQECVQLMDAEGYTYPQMAQVLKCSEKTIARDMKDIRQRNELSPSANFAKQFIGEVFIKAMNHHAHLTRLARSKDASTLEKVQAEFAAWKVLKELLEKLQSSGYVFQKPQEIIGDFSHHVSADDEKSLNDIRLEIAESERILSESGGLTPQMQQEINDVKRKLDKAEIESKVIEITNAQKKEIQNEK
ncbi:MAG: hypothetical protein HQL12_07565 [Candidatus Omnitrophica bacterium]|nr:hypothetical protein [Candidatus Omnitrophota bacterium]